jgi:hypothetical protein
VAGERAENSAEEIKRLSFDAILISEIEVVIA